MSGELKPCPVCGNRAFLSITGVPGHRSVWCLTDGCLRMAPRETAEEAAAAWNTRAELSSLRGEADVIGRLVGALAKIAPIVVENGSDYALVYFGDGETHRSQTMTMNPQDWLDIQAAFDALASLPDTVLPRPRRNASPSEVKTGRQGIGEV